MPTMSQTDLEHLQTHLEGLKNSLLRGVLVGAGSVVLNFSDSSTLLVQCPFDVFDGKSLSTGHGESPGTSVILFELLNQHVTDVKAGPQGEVELEFGDGKSIR